MAFQIVKPGKKLKKHSASELVKCLLLDGLAKHQNCIKCVSILVDSDGEVSIGSTGVSELEYRGLLDYAKGEF